MGIYIHGMAMPKDRAVIEIHPVGNYACTKYGFVIGRVIELPPHGRLIDADNLERMFADIDNAPYSGFDGEDPFYSTGDAVQIIRLAPTILPADPEGGGTSE